MKRFLALSMILGLAMIAAGCGTTGDDPAAPYSSDDPSLQVVDLDSPTGGFTETDEEPMFGEPGTFLSLEEGEGEECEYQDTLRERERIQEMERMSGARIYRLRAIWGRMAAAVDDSAVTECCPVDWSGGMKLEGGVIIIERVLKFDANDELVRTGPNTIRWTSRTCPHVDGVQVRLVVHPPVNPDSTVAPPDSFDVVVPEPKLTIVAGPYERTFTLDELEKLDMIEPVDDCGNNMAIASHRILPGCPRGYLLGEWNRNDVPDTLYNGETGEMRGIVYGHFKGIWVGERGWAVGYVRGIYGVNTAGERKFFGKYINHGGEFMGIITGDYGRNPVLAAAPGIDAGWFRGNWYGRNHGLKGRLKGEWVTYLGQGYFKGIWGMLCNDRM